MADVEVNRASTKDTCFECVLKGMSNRIVPKRIATIKLTANTWAGWNLLSPLILFLLNDQQFRMGQTLFSNLLLIQSFVKRLSN